MWNQVNSYFLEVEAGEGGRLLKQELWRGNKLKQATQ